MILNLQEYSEISALTIHINKLLSLLIRTAFFKVKLRSDL